MYTHSNSVKSQKQKLLCPIMPTQHFTISFSGRAQFLLLLLRGSLVRTLDTWWHSEVFQIYKNFKIHILSASFWLWNVWSHLAYLGDTYLFTISFSGRARFLLLLSRGSLVRTLDTWWHSEVFPQRYPALPQSSAHCSRRGTQAQSGWE